jgi:hypothetical protein
MPRLVYVNGEYLIYQPGPNDEGHNELHIYYFYSHKYMIILEGLFDLSNDCKTLLF